MIVPAISIYEVFKWIAREFDEKSATQFAGAMQQGWVVDIGPDLAIAAARLSRDFGLAMADSLILATARAHGATLWTQDEDFAKVPGVSASRDEIALWLRERIKTLIGITTTVSVFDADTLERTLVGKARRVFDKRKA